MAKFFEDEAGQELKVVLEGDDIPEGLRGKDMKSALSELAGAASELEALRTRAQDQEKQLQELSKKVTAPPTPITDRDPKEVAEEFAKKLEEDPHGTMASLVDERVKPLVNEQIKINMDTQIELMKKDVGKYPDFDKYEKEVREKLEKVPLNSRANPEVIKVVYDLARVADLDELKRKVESGEYEMPTREAAPRGQLSPSPQNPRRPQPDALSAEEKRQMTLWGFKDEAEYRMWKSPEGSEGIPLQQAKEKREEEAARQRMLGKR